MKYSFLADTYETERIEVTPESAAGGVYCDAGCHNMKPKYAAPKTKMKMKSSGAVKPTEAALHFK